MNCYIVRGEQSSRREPVGLRRNHRITFPLLGLQPACYSPLYEKIRPVVLPFVGV